MSEAIDLNLSVLAGRCSGPADVRELASGRRLARLAVRVPASGDRATSVPVSVWEPAGWIEELDVDDPVIVIGRVQRRFFRTAAGATGAQVEVEADVVARGTDARRRAALRRRAETALTGLE
jgi:hypothetical protein